MDGLQDETRLEGQGAAQQAPQRENQDEALRQQVSAAAADGDAATQARTDFKAASAECAHRQGRPRPSRQPRQRRREAEGRRATVLLSIALTRVRGRDGTAERRGGRGRRINADEPLAQDRRPSRERGVTMANSIAYTRSYTSVLGEVYKRAACLACLNCPAA